MFNDESDKPRGCGILEFATTDLARKAVDKMHKFDLKGRKLVVKEDTDASRDRYGRITKGDRRDRDRDRDRSPRRDRDRDRDRDRGSSSSGSGNTYGLSPQFLSSLDIDGPLHTRLFVANLAYDVGESKLKEVFRLAGRVCHAELNKDKDGKSRGHGVIEYSHPVEAVQAISMFNNQVLYGRKMMVRYDKTPGPTPEELEQLPTRLPEGLEGVGMGLGSNGNPLTNVAQNLPQIQNQNNQSQMGGGALSKYSNIKHTRTPTRISNSFLPYFLRRRCPRQSGQQPGKPPGIGGALAHHGHGSGERRRAGWPCRALEQHGQHGRWEHGRREHGQHGKYGQHGRRRADG